MSWLAQAVRRAGLRGAEELEIAVHTPVDEAWEATARALGLKPHDLAGKIASTLGLKLANTDAAEPTAVALLPERVARRYNVFPLREDDRTFTVATSNPMDL